MKKIIFIIILVVIIISIFTLWKKNIIVDAILKHHIKANTNLDISFEQPHINLFKSDLYIKNIAIKNPENFSNLNFIEAPYLYIDYNFFSIFLDKLILNHLEIHIGNILIEKDVSGKLNIQDIKSLTLKDKTTGKKETYTTDSDSLKLPKGFTEEKKHDRKFKIKKLRLILNEITYIEKSEEDYKKRVVKLKIDQTFTNITSFNQLRNIIISKLTPVLVLENIKKTIQDNLNLEIIFKDKDKMKKSLEDIAKDLIKDLPF